MASTYTISYNSNNGFGIISSQTKTENIDIVLADSGFYRSGYTLDGWSDVIGGSITYDLGSTYTDNASIILYAHWAINTYTVTIVDADIESNKVLSTTKYTEEYNSTWSALDLDPDTDTHDGYDYVRCTSGTVGITGLFLYRYYQKNNHNTTLVKLIDIDGTNKAITIDGTSQLFVGELQTTAQDVRGAINELQTGEEGKTGKLTIVIIDTLPTTGDENTIYLKKIDNTSTVTGDEYYIAYVCKNTTSESGVITSTWYKIGVDSSSNVSFSVVTVADTISTKDIVVSGNMNLQGTLSADEGIFETIAAESIKTEEFKAGIADIDYLSADSAIVTNITANSVKTKDIESVGGKFNYLTTDNLNSAYVQASLIEGEDINVTEAWIEKLMVQGKIIASDGTIYYLDSIHVDANSITAGTLNVDRINVKGEDGLYYKLNVDSMGEAEFEKLTDAEQLACQTQIHAKTIVANSITTEQITVENLVGTGGWINLSKGTFEYSNATTKNGISWDGETLNIRGNLIVQSTGKTIDKTVEEVTEKADNSIVSDTLYYLATNVSNDVSRDTSGWTTTIQTLTKANKYLWVYHKYTTAGGNITYSEPLIIGTYGESNLAVEITSSNGNIFKATGLSTDLTCNVYYGTEEVTNQVTKFIWKKILADGTEDPTWNRGTSADRITLTNDDVYDRASFTCSVEIDI